MLPVDDLKKISTDKKLVDGDVLKKAIIDSEEQKIPLEEFLILRKIITEKDLYKKAAEFYGIPFIVLNDKVILPDTLNFIPKNLASQYQLVAFGQHDGKLDVATCLPPDLQMLEFIKRKGDFQLNLFFTTPTEISSVIGQYRKDIKAEIKKVKFTGEEVNVIEITQGLLENAIRGGASDIHIEPKEERSLVRYRIDGVLREAVSLPKELHSGLITRVKILAHLKVDEHRLPQDGRFKMSGQDYRVSFRVSVVPLLEGEKVVLRILHQEEKYLTLEQLGLLPDFQKIIEEEIKKTQGMIISVGPTGCGKTTTLYTLLNMLNHPEVNISTVEDPIEYSLSGVNQSQINPQIGYTFAKGLRAFLRQDPNIIMVGEIRDEETAAIALHAALTGHLVLTTLHTNDAATTLPRLREMSIPSYLIASTVNLIIAQRLVRKVCPNCKKKRILTVKEIRKIEGQLGVNIQELLKKRNMPLEPLYVWRGEGCNLCRSEGLKGRIGVFEILKNTPEIYSAILRDASSRELASIAGKQGMLTLAEDGVIKIFQGLTTFEEIARVI